LVLEPGQPLSARVADALVADIREGRVEPGQKLPSERELVTRFGVSSATIRAALAVLRAQGLTTSRVGSGVFVVENPPLRRLSDDIVTAQGFYTMLARHGEQSTTKTEVRREPASAEVAEWLEVPPGQEVVVRARIMGSEKHPLVSIAVSYFPVWVVAAAPNLADPTISGLPKWLREAFGQTYSDDVLTARMPTAEEREILEIPARTPVMILRGTTRDQQHRCLHYISKVTVPTRFEYAYRFGAVPDDVPQDSPT